jgi:hypothetical protein
LLKEEAYELNDSGKARVTRDFCGLNPTCDSQTTCIDMSLDAGYKIDYSQVGWQRFGIALHSRSAQLT